LKGAIVQEDAEIVEIEEVGEESKEKVSKIKKVKVHLVTNQKYYIGAAAGIGTGVILGAVSVALRKPIVINYVMIKLNPHMAFVGGRTQKIVRDEGTGMLYESISDAAKLTGVSHTGIRKVVNGHQITAGGRKWTVVGVWSPWWGRTK
jgi:DNA endonuclease I-HmuI-like, NUMOD-like domain